MNELFAEARSLGISLDLSMSGRASDLLLDFKATALYYGTSDDQRLTFTHSREGVNPWRPVFSFEARADTPTEALLKVMDRAKAHYANRPNASQEAA